jgi:hypothetical protein
MSNVMIPKNTGRNFRLWFFMLSAFLFALCLPFTAKAAVSNLTVTSSNTDALAISDYQISFTVTEDLAYSDYMYVQFSKEFQINTLTSSISVRINGSDWGGASFLIYEGTEYNKLRIGVPSSIAAGDTVTILLTALDNNIEIINPWNAGTGTYPVSVSINETGWIQTEAAITYNTEISNPQLTTTPVEMLPLAANTWQMKFDTSRPLQSGDIIRLVFPEGTEFNFNYNNIVGWMGESRAFWLNGYAPEELTINGTEVSFKVTGTAASSSNTLTIEKDAIPNPLLAGTYDLKLSTSTNNIPVNIPFTVSPSLLSVSASSNEMYAKQVDYTLTFRPRSTVNEDNRIILALPNEITDMLSTANVTINDQPISFISPDGYYYITPAVGQSLSPTDPEPLKLTLHDLGNPDIPGTLAFGISTDTDYPLIDYAGIEMMEAVPKYDPAVFGHSLRLSNSQHLKVSSGAENNYGGSSAFTIGMWIKPESTTGTAAQTLYHKNWGSVGELQTYLYVADGKLKAGMDNFTNGGWTWLESTQQLPANEWSHVALVHTGSQAQLFINGQPSAETAAGYEHPFLGANPSNQPVNIGNHADGDTPYTGLIDDVQIWSQALDAGMLTSYMLYGYLPIYNLVSTEPASRYEFELHQGILKDSQVTKYAQVLNTEHFDLHAIQDSARYGTLPNLLGADLEGFSIAQPPSRGTASVLDFVSGMYSYSPEPAHTETDSFTFGVTALDRTSVLGTVDISVVPNLPGTDGSNADLFTLTAGDASIPLDPGQTYYNWTVPSNTWTITLNASGQFGQQITVGDEIIVPGAGKDWDLTEGINTIPIRVESYDHTSTRNYFLSVYQMSDEEETQINTALGFLTDDLLRGDNADLASVTMPLKLAAPWYYDTFPEIPEGFYFHWESSSEGIVDLSGYVYRTGLTEPENVTLTAVIARDNYRITKPFAVTVQPNHVPVVPIQPFVFVSHGEPIYGQLTASDADGDFLYYSLDSEVEQDRLFVSWDGYFNYTPPAGFTGEDRYTVLVTDEIDSATAEIVFHVFNPASTAAKPVSLEVNGAAFPLADDVYSYYIVLPQETVTFPVKVVGQPGQTITIDGNAAAEAVIGLDADGTNVMIRVQAENSIEYREYHLHVNRENDEQRVYRVFKSMTEHAILGDNYSLDQVVSGLKLQPDFVPADVRVDWVSSDESLVTNTGTVNRPMGADANVTLAMTVSKSVYSQSKNWFVTVLGHGNSAPVAIDSSVVSYSQPVTGSLKADDEGTSLTYFLVAAPVNGTVEMLADNAFTYTPTSGFTGQDFFTFKASDGMLESNIATVSIRVYGPAGGSSSPGSFQVDNNLQTVVDGHVLYSFPVPYNRTAADLIVTGKPGQHISIDGIAGELRSVPLSPGDNTVLVHVISEDGLQTGDYTLIIHRDTELPTAPVLSSLMVGADASSLHAVNRNGTLFTSVITGSTSVYVQPYVNGEAVVEVNGTIYNGIAPVLIPAEDYTVNLINIKVQHPAEPALYTNYLLSVQVDSGLASVTGAAYGNAEFSTVNGNQIHISGLPYGAYETGITINTLYPDAKVVTASLKGSPSVVYAVYNNSIQVPLNNTPITVSFIVQDRNFNTKAFELLLSQGDAPPPPPAPQFMLGLVETSGQYLTIRFDSEILESDVSKIRFRIGNEIVAAAGAYIDSTDHRRLKVWLGSPVLSGSGIALVLDDHAVTSAAGGKNSASTQLITNLSLNTGSGKSTLDVGELLQLPSLEALPAEIITHVLNQVTPRFTTPGT